MKKVCKCFYFTGVQNKTCEVGIDYNSFPSRVPCIFANEGNACPKYREPTKDEIAESEAEVNASIARIGRVMEGIAAWRLRHKGQSAQEIVECPECKGELHLSISSLNGHIHGHCETKGCVSWME